MNGGSGGSSLTASYATQSFNVVGDITGSGNLNIGPNNTIAGNYNISQGENNTVVGQGNVVIAGDACTASGSGTSNGFNVALGNSTLANGGFAFSQGLISAASGEFSHAEGSTTSASGQFAHSEGVGTFAVGSGSHSSGNDTIAYGNYSNTEGFGTIASGSYQSAVGVANTQGNTTSLFVIGNGQSSGSSFSRSDLALFNSQSITFNQPLTASSLIVNTGSLKILSGSITAQEFIYTGSYYNVQTGTTYTFTTTDNGKIVSLINSSPITVTIPSGLDGSWMTTVFQSGSGQVTITGSGGVNIYNSYGFSSSYAQYSLFSVVQVSPNIFVTQGAMTY